MKTHQKLRNNPVLSALGVALLALALSACGGGSSSDTTTPASNDVDNPDNIDVNGDGILDAEDDVTGDGVVDNDDVVAFAVANPTDPMVTDPNALEGNIQPDCSAVDCNSANDAWSDNALIAQNRSPVSTYSLGIQRILFCLSIGSTTNEGTTIENYADGVYGSRTAMDMESYQNSKDGLVADGVVGMNTWDALQRDLSTLVASGDGLNQLWTVSSVRTGCENLAQFAQLLAEPMSWQLVAVPGGTTYIPFSVNFSDLP